jgi:hypothetical protein
MQSSFYGAQHLRLGRWATTCASITLVLALTSAASAQNAADADFHRGFFLEEHENDLAGAAAAYERVVNSQQASASLKREAAGRLAAVNEDVATKDLAALMPPEAIAYVEISDLGEHVEELVQMLNLQVDASQPSSRGGGVHLGDGLYLPERITISPSLLAELKNVRGVAAAVTGVCAEGCPLGVAVIHPGNSNIVRGFIESAVQVLQPVEPVGGFPTFTYEDHVWIVQTARLVVVGSSREEVESAIARLSGKGTSRLTESDAFTRMADERENATLFAWFSGPRVVEQLRGVMQGEEAMIASAVLDLEHLQVASVAVGPTEQGLAAEVKIELDEGHHNLAYGLVRTAPLSGRALAHVPSGIAGLALIGLNPPAVERPSASPADAPQYVAALDIGRELFSNIEEIAIFALPQAESGAGELPLPEMGLVVAVKDVAKSQALWNQLLTIPGFALPQLPPPADIQVGGHSGKEFRYPDAPPIQLVRLGDDGLVLGTRGAVAAAVGAQGNGTSVAADAGFQPLLAELTPSSSKAILVDVGRAIETAATANPHEADELQMVASLVGGLRVSLVTDEQPTSLTVRLAATNLPDVQKLIDIAVAHEQGALQREAARAALAR